MWKSRGWEINGLEIQIYGKFPYLNFLEGNFGESILDKKWD
jgi:hypothetical protein